jgi:DNA-binding XRE family transcriptional regulator
VVSRREDEKKWTQEALAVLFGVARETIRNWEIMPNGQPAIVDNGPKPDARVKLNAAKRLREEDEKKWTQEALGTLFGVAQNTVSRWLVPNMQTHNTHQAAAAKDKPDARVKLNRAAQDDIIDRLGRNGTAYASGARKGPRRLIPPWPRAETR